MTSLEDGWWSNLSDKEKQDTYTAYMLKNKESKTASVEERLARLEEAIDSICHILEEEELIEHGGPNVIRLRPDR